MTMTITTSAATPRPPLESNLPIAFARALRRDGRTEWPNQPLRRRRNPINSSTLSSSSLRRGLGTHL